MIDKLIGGDGAPAQPPVANPGGAPNEFGLGGENAWQPGTPYQAGQSVAGDDREGRMAMMNWEADQRAQRDRENRYNWTDADWDNVVRRALRPQTRQDERGNWEYLVHGNWVEQGVYDDPLFRQNILEPWLADVENYWRGEREKADKYRRGKEESAANAAREAAQRRRGGRRAGPARSSTSRRG